MNICIYCRKRLKVKLQEGGRGSSIEKNHHLIFSCYTTAASFVVTSFYTFYPEGRASFAANWLPFCGKTNYELLLRKLAAPNSRANLRVLYFDSMIEQLI